jgi:hypothetical protein
VRAYLAFVEFTVHIGVLRIDRDIAEIHRTSG